MKIIVEGNVTSRRYRMALKKNGTQENIGPIVRSKEVIPAA
jgi:hypothetical protein